MERGAYISLNVVVSVDLHQIGPLNVIGNVDCDCNIPLEFCTIWFSIDKAILLSCYLNVHKYLSMGCFLL